MEQFMEVQRPLLGRLSGSEPISVHSSFWLELVSFPGHLRAVSPQELLVSMAPYCQQIAANDRKTDHYAKLVFHITQLVHNSPNSDTTNMCTTANGVCLLTVLTVNLVSIVKAEDLKELFAMEQEVPIDDLLDNLIGTCLSYLEQTDINPHCYALHWEILHLLIGLCSSQLYTGATTDPDANLIQDPMHCSSRSHRSIMHKLFSLYMARHPAPAFIPVFQPAPPPLPSTSMVASFSRAATDFMTLPMRMSHMFMSSAGPLVSDSALHLLLLLLHYCPPITRPLSGSYRSALQGLRNSDSSGLESLSAVENGRDGGGGSSRVSFSGLFDVLTSNLHRESSLLLLYNLMNGCPAFLEALLVRTDIDVVFLPLLQQLYTTDSNAPHHLYMLQIIVLILTQDATLNRSLHKFRIDRVLWYTDRNLKDVDLASLIYIVLLRTAQHNLVGYQDVHLHTNTLAALTNLAPYMTHLCSQATHRLVFILEVGLKRLQKKASKLTPLEGEDMTNHFLTNVIELIDTLIVHTLPRNAELVYTLLHQQEVIQKLSLQPGWSVKLSNVAAVLTQFNVCVETAQHDAVKSGSGDWSSQRLLSVIEGKLATWTPSHLRPVPELKFTYEESLSSEEFFLPYVWSLIAASPFHAFPESSGYVPTE